MRFLVDAQLPLTLKTWLRKQDFDVIHTRDLPTANLSSDHLIMEISDQQDRILISKDSDFFRSNLINGTPRRLLMITTGNIQNRHLLELFDKNFSTIKDLFQAGAHVVEMNNDNIVAHA